MPASANEPKPTPPWWLRERDQRTLGLLAGGAIVLLAAGWLWAGGARRWVDLDRAPVRAARFEVDPNRAGWAELAQLPGVGETLARRIVESREREGPFQSIDDLVRIRGIGPKVLDRMRTYLVLQASPPPTAGS